MRDFSWNVFAKTGDVDAYLLYKQAGMTDELEELTADTAPIAEQSAD
ncbi:MULTISPECIES: YqzL family protein [Paenibacillus]|uniref:YqzL family protein n=1 Tax=Paenibacillus alvei TaxID=44250 RepID=A0AAP7DGS4_PAEAL|nr:MULTISPECIES: YqzL family protein [Paenibacillus]MCY7486989.1 YqzL family protein [Paenibacillus alvei]MCY9582264.1 YqzL family protein [Paenibacillus alvei]MCY9587066.1 YqzL family protein [Paenibacillus alvei]NEZ40914.1 YqzL family protein [Paenibacillus alvei]NOJ69728.1 YqzL family protein [Paenibacillus alvei]